MGMQDIVECVGGEDMFFDSADLFSEEGDSSVSEVLKYEFWRNELRSVKERRDTFLSEMGFVESSPLSGFDSSSRSSSFMSNEDEDVGFSGRDNDSDVNVVVDEQEHEQSIRPTVAVCDDDLKPSTSSGKSFNKRIGQWWKTMSGKCKCKEENAKYKKFEIRRTKVHVNKKKVKELSALFEAQEIQAHNGIIWSMKFSPDGQYLASGGQDGVVRVWRVKSVNSCCDRPSVDSISRRTEKVKVRVVVPENMFQIEEHPFQEFHGHSGDVLDLAWSHSNYLLSSSTDKTVRLWNVESEKCLSTFLHTDYVTCIQFNPTDDQYFISGSIDGKVRIWGVSKRRVLDWADVRDAVTAVCYQPDGHGFVVGSLSGTCRFYDTKDNMVELSAHTRIRSKKSSTNKITGIQFLPEDSQRVMVMTEDSKLRILDKEGRICKYRGPPKSGGQMSASFSSNKTHIISVGEDSSVYMWDHEDPYLSSSRPKKSDRSCEHFISEGVSVATLWSGTETASIVSPSRNQSPLGFSFSGFFSSKSSSAIWPEDILPIFDVPQEESKGSARSSAWGIVIVTANCDGMIRTFHNYGLPIKV